MAELIIASNKIDDFGRHMAQARAVLTMVENGLLEAVQPDEPKLSHVEVQTLAESVWAIKELLGLAKADIETSLATMLVPQ